jgi:hypothetical protein
MAAYPREKNKFLRRAALFTQFIQDFFDPIQDREIATPGTPGVWG